MPKIVVLSAADLIGDLHDMATAVWNAKRIADTLVRDGAFAYAPLAEQHAALHAAIRAEMQRQGFVEGTRPTSAPPVME